MNDSSPIKDIYCTADMSDVVQSMKAQGNDFAVATVVRTVSVTAAKPGAKAIINAAGEIVEGWIGGGCARHAVVAAAQRAIADSEPRFVSIQPEELLAEQGLHAGDDRDGVMIASNMCPSKGSMEVFVEPVLSSPQLLVLGASPVAQMLARLAGSFGFSVAIVGESLRDVQATQVDRRYPDAQDIEAEHGNRYVVVATQGSGDVAALSTALRLQSRYIGFVGSGKKTNYLKEKLRSQGQPADALAAIVGPAGLDIGGVTPQEIALSILAEIIQRRRCGASANSRRQTPTPDQPSPKENRQ